MADALGPLVRTLAKALGEDADATAIADALWLATAPTAPRTARGPVAEPSDAVAADPQRAPAVQDTDPPVPPRPEEGSDAAALYENLPHTRPAPGPWVAVPGGRDLPRAMELRRALRPFKRRYPRGRRSELDLDATIRDFGRSGELAPVFSPSPEPWFELLLVIDTSPSMAVWESTNAEFATLLAGLGAFRRVRTWGLRPGSAPTVIDHQGRRVSKGQANSSDGRRLVLVLSDCVAPGWRQPETWRLLRRWGATGPVALLNPLPSRLWHRTGLNLPAIRVKQRRPALKNTDLTFQVPLLLSTLAGAEEADWQALPTLAYSPHSLARWAETFMRGAPHGYDAVLVPRTGILPSPFRAPQTRHRVGPDPVEAFLRTASPMAVQLAALCSPFSQLSLPLMHLIRQQLLPEAGVGELAELLTSPVVHTRTFEDGPPVVAFDPTSRERLAGHLSRRDAWLTHDALSRHIAARSPGGVQDIQAMTASDPESVPRELRPFARASRELLALLREGEPVQGVPLPRSSEGPVAARAPGLPQGLPDPGRSAAVLIGVSEYGSSSLRGVEADLVGMRSFLTSQGGWNLPGDRCVTLANPSDEHEVFDAIRRACDMADTVLLCYSGHGTVDDTGQALWLLAGDVSEARNSRTLEFGSIARFLESAGPRHVMMILDHDGGTTASRALSGWGRPGHTDQGNVGLQALFVDSARDTPSGGQVTQELLRVATEGAPGGPEFLYLTDIAGYMESSAVESRPNTLFINSPFPNPAFALNRAWEEASARADTAIEEAYNVMRANLLEALPRTYRGTYQREADRLLRVLLAFAVEFIDGTEHADSQAELTDVVQDFLDRRGLITEREVLLGQRRADVVWRSKAGDFAVEITADEDPHDWNPFGPLSYQLMLRREQHAETSDLLDYVSTLVADSLDESPCLVAIRLPAPRPYPPDLLAAKVESACEQLIGESIATPSDDDRQTGWTLNGLELPAGLTNLTIQGITPDTESIVWDTVEEYEYGLVLGQVTVDAELMLEGFMYKSDYCLAESDVRLSEELNDHMVEVSLYRDAQLVFDARRESEELIELQFHGTNAPESHPHDPM
ncbi:SAV_2336 N-terminal domain-related protein [Streptomyces sp. NPDC101149]|uniref:SAV_2336 N-terminal domain-related protein n=1 Tax=Streptomyces sp. NPDC101149 TaxID=3366113 RepID=UPI003830786B